MATKGRRRLHSVLLVVGLLVAAIGSTTIGFLWDLDRTVNDHVQRVDGAFPPESVRPPARDSTGVDPATRAGAPVTLLVLGAQSLPASATAAGYSSDTILLVRLAANRDRVDVVSIPPDAIVAIPGYGSDRISAATTRGGLPLAVQSVEDLLGARIDHVAVIDLDAVREVTDALGGVRVQVPQPFEAGGRNYRVGPAQLDGRAAAAFVREQASLPGGDLDRGRNQRAYLAGLAAAVTDSSTLTQPTKLREVLVLTADNVVVDSELTPASLRTMALSLQSVRGDDVRMWSTPVARVRRQGDGPLSITLDEAGRARLRTALADDAFDDYVP